ncbi:hypothetical protein D3C75_706180 [compost metagenome]
MGVSIQLMNGLACIGHLPCQAADAALALTDLGLTGDGQPDRIAGGGGGKLGVAGDLLSGGCHLGHRGRHHDDLVLLLAHSLAALLGPRRLGSGLSRQFDGDVPQPADDTVQPGHEQVEVLGQQPHLVPALGHDLHREIPLAVSDVGQRLRHPAEIGKQVIEHGDEQGAEHQQQHQSQPHQLPQQTSEGRFQHILVHHHGEQPVGAWHPLHRQQHLTPRYGGDVQLAVPAPALQGRPREAGGQLGHLFQGQRLLRVADDQTGAVEQHGVPLPLHLHGQHLIDEVIQGEIRTGYPDHLTLMAHRLGQGHHHLLHGHADVGRGDDELARLGGILIPGTHPGIVVGGVEGGIVASHGPLHRTKIGEAKATGGTGLQQVWHQGCLGIVGNHCGQGIDRMPTICQPVADGYRVGVAVVDRLALDGAKGA